MMKTPWSSLLEHGTTIAVLIVLAISAIAMLIVVGLAVLMSKILVIIR